MDTTPSNLLGRMPNHMRTPLGNAPQRDRPQGTTSNGTLVLSILQSGMAAEFHRPLEALHNNLGPNGGDLGDAFQGLSQGHQSQLRLALGSGPLTELFSLSRLPQGRRFGAGLYRWASRQEAEGKLALAGTAYQILQNLPEAGSLRERARHRLEIFQGGGSFGERFSFQINPMMKQIFDPAFFGSMLVGGGMFHLARGTAVNALRGMSLGGLTRSTGFLRSASWVAGVTAEAPAFALSHHGLNHFMGRTPPPGSPGLGKEILSAGITLSALRLGGIGTRAILGQGARTLGAASPFVRASSVVLSQFGMYTGILGAHALGSHLDLHPASKTPLSDSLITLFHFNVAGMALNAWTGGRYSRWTHQTEGKLETQFQKQSFWQGGFNLGHPALAAEGVGPIRELPSRKEVLNPLRQNISQMSSLDGGPEGPITTRGPYQGYELYPPGPNQAVILPSKYTYTPARHHLSNLEIEIYYLIQEQQGTKFWYQQSQQNAREQRQVVQEIYREIQSHPRAEEFNPHLEEMLQHLNRMNQIFERATSIPPGQEKLSPLTKYYLGKLSNIPNKLTNFLFSGEVADLAGATKLSRLGAKALEKILLLHEHLPEALQGRETVPAIFRPDASRLSLDLTQQIPTRVPQRYDFPADGYSKDIVTRDNPVLLTGDLTGMRENIFTEQRTESFRLREGSEGPLMNHLATLGRKVRHTHIADEKPENLDSQYPYLESYDPLSLAELQGSGGVASLQELSSFLRPGGVGYLVHKDSQALSRMVQILDEARLGDIIEASLDSPLVVESSRPDAEKSNYLFFRRLPYSPE